VNRTSYGWIQLLYPFVSVLVSLSLSRLVLVSTSPFPQSPHLRTRKQKTENSGSVCQPHPSLFSLRSKSQGHCPAQSPPQE
jgi:hypothetical protein